MRKVWNTIGRVAFWTSWPLLRAYLRFAAKRTRVLVVADDQILLVKSWLGSGHWVLPGGGLRRGEDSQAGAVREIKEETGLIIEPVQLTLLHEDFATDNGLKVPYAAFAAELTEITSIHFRRPELTDATWMPIGDVLAGEKSVSRTTRDILRAWHDKV